MSNISQTNIDFSQMVSVTTREAARDKARSTRLRTRCRTLIGEIASAEAQTNLAAAAALGTLQPEQWEAYRALVKWIDDMRRCCARHIADKADPEGHWPRAPQTVRALTRAF